MLIETSSHFFVVLSQKDFEREGPIVTPIYSAAVAILHENQSPAWINNLALHWANKRGVSGKELMTMTVLATLSGMAETIRQCENNQYKGNS